MAKDAANHVDWDKSEYFSPDEWPEGVLEWMSCAVITTLESNRARLPAEAAWTPSPVARAHVRHDDSGSRHSTKNKERLSDATDFFVDWDYAWQTWNVLLASKFGGLGIYPDMEWEGKAGARCMFHVDMRDDRRLVWVGWREQPQDKLRYVYLPKDPIRYHQIVAERCREP